MCGSVYTHCNTYMGLQFKSIPWYFEYRVMLCSKSIHTHTYSTHTRTDNVSDLSLNCALPVSNKCEKPKWQR